MEAWMKSSSVTLTSGKTLIKPSWHRGNTDQHTLPKISEGSAPLPSHLRFQDRTEIDTFLNWHQVEAHQKRCPPANIRTIQGWMRWWLQTNRLDWETYLNLSTTHWFHILTCDATLQLDLHLSWMHPNALLTYIFELTSMQNIWNLCSKHPFFVARKWIFMHTVY